MIKKYISVVVLIFTTLMLNTYNAKEDDSLEPTSILFNFTDSQTTAFENWIEVSDAILIGGRSKATIVRLNGTNYQSALMFYLLNPRENGSSFAGVYRQLDTPDISKYKGVVIDLHRQGVNSKFQFILYGECSELRECVSHESEFETSEIRGDVKIPFSRFKPYFRGTPKSGSNHLNLSHTSHIGIKVYGGSNAPDNQFAPGSIEIFTISAYK